ncbi:hypothetical protein COBRASIX_60 [Enterobacter phage vB_EclS_CobraSix]|uniref:Protein ren n=2 Tax=root TaxID=1 RepID=A0AAE9CAV0_9CAUD|nr:Ren-like exclusion protein [Enterobacter phage vB_EclS_CobraSix]UGO47225.1 hypothetical protein COBRASIX_60 [Enterobacter phage vB_EclS_CobraSix]
MQSAQRCNLRHRPAGRRRRTPRARAAAEKERGLLMKGKQAILRYLETHRTFTAKDVATECGMTINCITKNAIDLERARKIVRVNKVWRTVTYRLATPEEQDGTARSCTNGIFQECRNSPAMKRVLMVWGRVGV